MKIKTRLIILILIMIVGTLCIIGGYTIHTFFDIMDNNYDEFSGLSESLGDDMHSYTLQNSIEYTQTIVSKQADGSGEKIGQAMRVLKSEAENLEIMYQHELKIHDHPLYEGVITLDGVDETEEILKEEHLLSDVMESVDDMSQIYPVFTNFYVVSETGIAGMMGETDLYRKFDLRQEKFYKNAIEANGKFVWGEAYLDVSNKICVTGSMAYYGKDGNPAGVVAIDLFVDEFVKNAKDSKIGTDGEVFFIIPDGVLVPENEFVEQIYGDEEWISMVKLAMKTPSGVLHGTMNGRNYYLIYDTIKETNWKFCSVISEEEITREAKKIRANLNLKVNAIRDEDMLSVLNSFLKFFGLIIACLAISVVVACIFADAFSRPIVKITKGVKEIGDGNYDYVLKHKLKDEIGQLADSVNKMAADIKNSIDEIARMTTEKQKIDIEMNLAADIQKSMIPSEKLVYNGIEIEGLNDPAMEVGGDFFDYFIISENLVGLTIADVSDKGMAAALFMAISKTILKELSLAYTDLESVIYNTNNILCRNNPQMQFVTVFAGILDINSGILTYVNAGHEKPFIYSKEEGLMKLEVASNVPLGIMEDTKFEMGTIEIKPGGFIFEYTDGVTEGLNTSGEQFQEDRIESALKECIANDENPVQAVQKRLNEFCEGTDQFDDITMISLKRAQHL